MKATKPERKARTLFLSKEADDYLLRLSLELSLKHSKKITRSAVVERVLLKFGDKLK